MSSNLYMARPILPDREKLNELLETIWTSRILTNGGPLHNQLEAELRSYLSVPVAKLFTSGTMALVCTLRSLGLSEGAEIITTPLTFAATAHAITFCGYKLVFADISEESLTLDPAAVEMAVTDKTEAVIGVHVYGTLCDYPGLHEVCQKHNLKLIFDAAHAFGASKDGDPVGLMGDASIFSFHATKLYNTFEGGLVTTDNEDIADRLKLVRNFGILNEEQVDMVGTNGKMSELHAAIGLLNLPLVKDERAVRAKLRAKYDAIIASKPGLSHQNYQPGVVLSEQYYALVVDPEVYGHTRDEIYEILKSRGVFSRRYFWPICSDFKPYQNHKVHSTRELPVVDEIKDKVLCLPFHSGVENAHLDIITDVFLRQLN